MSAFIRHLERSSATVATWPEWKRNIFGGSEAGMSERTIDELREVAEALSGALQISTRENDLLRRQVEEKDRQVDVLVRFVISESPNDGGHRGQPQCHGCWAPGDCKDESECMKRLREWSLAKAKNGGGGE